MKSHLVTKSQPSYPVAKERIYYEEIIDKLTKENERLKRQLETLADLKKAAEGIDRAETKE